MAANTSELADHRLEELERATERHSEILEDIRDSLKELVKVQVTLTAVIQQQQDHENRLREIEKSQPLTRQANDWMGRAVVAVIGAALMFIWQRVTTGGH